MADQLYGRLTRAAVLGTVQPIATVVALLVGIEAAGASLALLVLALLLLLAWGPYQAQIALNSSLDDRGRRRWRSAMWCVPGAMPLYWHRYIRGLRSLD